MTPIRTNTFSIFALLLALGIPLSASGAFKPKQFPKPTYYSLDSAEAYRNLTIEGYDLLDQGKFDEAVATFKRQIEMIPEGRYGAYNLACAYGRDGKVDEALEWLTVCVDGGWERAKDLEEDPDLVSLQSDSLFWELVSKSRENRTAGEKLLSSGIPVYNWTQATIETEDSLDEWVDEQRYLIRRNGHIWHRSDYVKAKLHLEAERLGALRKMRQYDREYNFRMARVRSLASVRSMWENWGPLSEAVVKECELYFKNAQSVETSAEANYYAGLAKALQYEKGYVSDKKYARSRKAAKVYFSQVPDDAEFSGAANAYLMAIRLEEAGDNREALLSEVRDVVTRYSDDTLAVRVFSVLYSEDAIRAVWPLPLNAKDMDGNAVTLADYEGKLLLIDFWATWCGPCLHELPTLLKTYEDFKDQGFEILSISLDYGNRISSDSLAAWTSAKGMNWRHVYEELGRKSKIADRYFVDAIPMAFLVGRDGTLIAHGFDFIGQAVYDAVEQAVKTN